MGKDRAGVRKGKVPQVQSPDKYILLLLQNKQVYVPAYEKYFASTVGFVLPGLGCKVRW